MHHRQKHSIDPILDLYWPFSHATQSLSLGPVNPAFHSYIVLKVELVETVVERSGHGPHVKHGIHPVLDLYVSVAHAEHKPPSSLGLV